MVESARSLTRALKSLETLGLMLFCVEKESLVMQGKTGHCGVVIASGVILLIWPRLKFGLINIFSFCCG